jgi:predicted DNA-binding protein
MRYRASHGQKGEGWICTRKIHLEETGTPSGDSVSPDPSYRRMSHTSKTGQTHSTDTGENEILKNVRQNDTLTVRISPELKKYLSVIAERCEITSSQLVRETISRMIQEVRESTNYIYDEEALGE